MKKLWDNGLLPQVIGLFILIVLLGVAPRPHEIRRGFALARQAQRENNPQTADELAFLAERLPWRDDLWEQAALAAYFIGMPEDSLDYLRQIDSLSYEGCFLLGEAYAETNDLENAIQTWELQLDVYGPSEKTLTKIYETHLRQDDYELAIDTLKELFEYQSAESYLPNSQYPISNTYFQFGVLLAAHDPASAPPFLLRAIDLDFDKYSYLNELAFVIQRALAKDEPAYALLVSGRQLAQYDEWDHTVHAFREAVKQRPDYAEAWAYLGEAYQHLETDHGEEALGALEKALSLNPDSLAANTFMALYHQRNGNLEEAQQYLELAAKLDADNPTLLTHLGETVAQLGNIDTALEFFDKAIQLDPYDAATYRALVEFSLRFNLDLHNQALPAARQAVMLAPDDPGALDVMGQLLFRLGDTLNAERFYLRALAADTQYAPTHLHLGLLYLVQGQQTRARDHLNLALSLAPDTFTANQAQRLLDEIGSR